MSDNGPMPHDDVPELRGDLLVRDPRIPAVIAAVANMEMVEATDATYCPFCSWRSADSGAEPDHDVNCPVLMAQDMIGRKWRTRS